MGALASLPLCQRARGLDGDGNNNLPGEEDRNVVTVHQVVEVQPEATSTPKMDSSRRRIEPLPEGRDSGERDLGDSSNSDSLESELEARAVGERTFGSDSGLEQSGDELEVPREEVEPVMEEESMEDLNVALDDDTEEEEEEEEDEDTVESLATGDLGVDRATTFRVPARPEPPLDMELEAMEEEFSEPLPNEEEEELEEEEEEESPVRRKLAELGVSEEEEAITNMLSDLATGPGGGRDHGLARR